MNPQPKWMQQVRGTGRHGCGNPRDSVLDPDDVRIALQRVRRGDPCPLINAPSRRAVVAALTADGWSSRHIAMALGLAQRSVVRHRAAVRKTGFFTNDFTNPAHAGGLEEQADLHGFDPQSLSGPHGSLAPQHHHEEAA